MTDSLIAFLLTVLIIELTPGPNMGYLVMTALTHGRSPGLAQIVGIAIGLLLAGALSVLGLTQLFQIWPPAYDIMRYAGVAYLLWLSYDAWRETPLISVDCDLEAQSYSRYIVRGVLSNLLNPKAYMFYVSVLPEFYTQTLPGVQAVGLTIAYVCIATAIHLALVFGAARLRPILLNRTGMIWLSRAFAISLALIAVWLLFSTARH